jgi:hypothetical protein
MESPIFIKSFCWLFLGFIKIDNSPSLLCFVTLGVNQHRLSLSVLTVLNIKAFPSSWINITEMVCLIFENLEPLRVCTPNLHLVSSSRILDIPRLIVISSSDGQRLLMEVPDLGSSPIWCLNDHVSVVNEIKVPILLQFRDNIEVSFNIETKITIKLTLGWFIWILISIDNLPLLVNSSMLVVDDDILTFIVKSS